MEPLTIVLVIVAILLPFLLWTIWAVISFFSLWSQARFSGSRITLFNLIGMSFRKIPPKIIIDAFANLDKSRLKNISQEELEAHFLAGGKVPEVIRALLTADKANIVLDWRVAAAIDLAGRDLFEAVKSSINPKVLDCPLDKDKYLSAVAKNGIELLLKARVTVRTNIVQLIGGATEETLIAHICQQLIGAIGSKDSHEEALRNPEEISLSVLSKKLDKETAFEILSIDITEITVGSNIGAAMRAEQAGADMKVIQAKAEGRKAMALALEQAYAAKIKEAEVKVPLAIAQALDRGELGVMEYHRLKNLEADTEMRQALSREGIIEEEKS